MKHVAIDLGSRESQVCVRAEDGSILTEARVETRSLPKLVSKWDPSRVILETSAEAFRIADAAKAHGHEVRVVPATLVRQLGVGSRSVKNDRKDARVLSEASCRIDLPSVHVPTERSRLLKSLCGTREALVRSRTMLINNIRGWQRTQLVKVRSGTRTFPQKLREYAKTKELPVPDHIERSLLVIDALNLQLRDADKQVAKIASDDPVCRNLMTTPGVGPITAVRFVAALDDVGRFKNAHRVQSYLGLTPGESSSATRTQKLGITKAGSSDVRRALIQAAWSLTRSSPMDPMVGWANQIADRRGRFVAIVALARKLAGVLFALWRDNTAYRATRAPMTT